MLFVGYRDKPGVSVFFILPSVALAKLYSITILATFNNRPHAVGGPPTIPDTENNYDTMVRPMTNKAQLEPIQEIRIGRTVQVWTDSIPMSNIEVRAAPAAGRSSLCEYLIVRCTKSIPNA